jgi:chromatin segregation and condensation protein Rec8/ScpA/Scc1 (kleisin family)
MSISLEKTLSLAQADPESAQFSLILQLLDLAISSLSTTEQLKLAGDTIAQVGQLYQLKAEILFSSLETTASDYNDREPILDSDLLSGLLRHSLTLNLEDLIEQHPYRTPKKSRSIQKTISKEELYKLIDEQEEEDWQVSHEENFTAWQETIDRYLRKLPRNTNKISLLQLANSIDLPLSVLWLTLLLGDYNLEQTGDFYDLEGIWINSPLDK